MGSARSARDKCRQNGFPKHWKKHGEPPKVCAFFKSMIGNEFDISMVIPPKFSKKLESLVGKKFSLEDSSGRKWDVILTCTGGSLAFVTGWLNFVTDHGIQHGDFLVFYYLSDRRFLVEIYGKNACTKIVSSERIDTNKKTKTTRNSIPKKRSYNSLDEESASKKHFHTSFSGPNIDVTPSPKNVNEKEPVSENLDELFFMTRQDTNFAGQDDRDRLFDLSEFETPVKKPTINEEEKRDYLQDPVVFCLPESEKFQNAGTEAGHVDLHKCLVPERNTEVLSAPPEYTEADFLVPECTPHSSNATNDSVPLDSIKSQQTIHKSENLDFSAPPGWKMRPTNQEAKVFKQEVYGNVMADNTLGASDSRSEQSYRNPRETLIHTMKVEGGKMRSIHQERREFKQEVYGNVMADNSVGASDKFQNAGTEAGHVDIQKCLVLERKTEVLSEYIEADFLVHECTPHSSNSPNDSVPSDSITRQQTIHKSKNLDLSAPPGWKKRPTNQEAKAFKQEVYGNMMADNTLGASDSRSEQSYRNPGETLLRTMKLEGWKMRSIHQEARAFKQEVYGNVMADNSVGASDSRSEQRNHGDTLIHTMKVEGGTSRPIKQEAREFKPDISGCPTSGCLGANFFAREQSIINYVGELVKAEPLNRVYPSEIGVESECPIPLPPFSEDLQN